MKRIEMLTDRKEPYKKRPHREAAVKVISYLRRNGVAKATPFLHYQFIQTFLRTAVSTR